ncbi:MAG: AbrB/MazE/SpoVT family DNA-binding domain-containing protein [Prochlorococcaceae cyanobacterium]
MAVRSTQDSDAGESALVILSSKGQLVIPAALRRRLGLGPGSRLSLTLEGQGLRLEVASAPKIHRAAEVIGCSGYRGPTLPIEAMDPAAFAVRA